MSHFRKLEAMYASGGINRYFQPVMRVAEGTAEVRMTVRPDMYHAAGAVHGSAYFKMLDDAAFFAVQSLVTESFVLTSSFTVYLLSPVTEGEMVAHGRVLHRSRRLFTAESSLYVGDALVAHGTGVFVRGATALDERVGYRT